MAKPTESGNCQTLPDSSRNHEYNVRYVYYANAHGKSPQDMMAHDTKKYPGGCMTGFLLWMACRKREFSVAHPEAMYFEAGETVSGRIKDQVKWTEFLEKAAKDAKT